MIFSRELFCGWYSCCRQLLGEEMYGYENEYEVEGARPRTRPEKTWREIVQDSYNGRVTGNHIWPIKWHQHQWMPLNSIYLFEFFPITVPGNCCTLQCVYKWIKSICDLWFQLVKSAGLLMVTVIYTVKVLISQKCCKIVILLLQIT